MEREINSPPRRQAGRFFWLRRASAAASATRASLLIILAGAISARHYIALILPPLRCRASGLFRRASACCKFLLLQPRSSYGHARSLGHFHSRYRSFTSIATIALRFATGAFLFTLNTSAAAAQGSLIPAALRHNFDGFRATDTGITGSPDFSDDAKSPARRWAACLSISRHSAAHPLPLPPPGCFL